MLLSESDAIYAADRFINYYSRFNRIDDYLRHVKKERMNNRPGYLFGADSEFFDSFKIFISCSLDILGLAKFSLSPTFSPCITPPPNANLSRSVGVNDSNSLVAGLNKYFNDTSSCKPFLWV